MAIRRVDVRRQNKAFDQAAQQVNRLRPGRRLVQRRGQRRNLPRVDIRKPRMQGDGVWLGQGAELRLKSGPLRLQPVHLRRHAWMEHARGDRGDDVLDIAPHLLKPALLFTTGGSSPHSM